MNEVTKALVNADENFLVSLSNKGVYKRACKDTDGMMLISREEGDSVIVEISGETVSVKSPLAESSCTCISRTVCRHIIGAIILLKNNLNEEDFADVSPAEEIPEPEPEIPVNQPEEETAKAFSAGEIGKINECAVHCLDMLGDILKRGLVRIPETAPENMEISAVRCHSLKMAEAERAVREIGTRMGECLARRASFSISFFTQKICSAVRLLENLCEDDIDGEMLGNFRQEYKKYPGYLTLLPLGKRIISGGDYEGEIYYFLNPDSDETPFMSVSDVRPSFYESTSGRRRSKISPWGMAVTLDMMMKRKIVLANAKVNGGKISTSQETVVAMSSAFTPDCEEVSGRIYCDFRQAVVELYEKNPQNELDRTMLIHPAKCVSSGFDRHTQQYTLVIEDESGFPAFMRVKYREETRELVELVEKIGEIMISNPDKDYTILATARIEKDELVLFPIEIYDFISVPEYDEYWLPDEYGTGAENVDYCNAISELLDEIQGDIELMVQCGIQSGISQKLENRCFNYGLRGLNKLVGDFRQAVESYRHNTTADIKDILHKMAEIEQYISEARKRLEIIMTLNRRLKDD
ncbi:MAG: hypothetical protein NC340_07735 [Ruminococcus flavefaciens]|nr:hypothetical protein [Ruminococcus flavefaciens]MCM1229872.1 hypothetical protein [Ruminococcus flavefaciens]